MADEDNTTPKSGEKPQKRGRKRAKTKRFFKKRYIFLLLIIAAALFWVGWRYFSSFVSTDDAFVEGHIIRVSPKISGIISKLHIDDNEHVKKGALLIEIDDRDFKVRYEQAKASYDMALYRQKSAKATENAADIDLELAKQDLERYEGLFKKGAVSQQELDRARSKYEQARASLTGAQENVFSKRKNKVADAELQKLSAAAVSAHGQSALLRRIEPLLTEEEHGIFLRGRNAKKATKSKNADVAEYNRSTGFEAVLGYLYLTGDEQRIYQLLEAGNAD